MLLPFSYHLRSKNIDTDSLAMSQESGFLIHVGPCIITPGEPVLIVVATSSVVSVAAIVIYPPVRAFPIHMISGVIQAYSQAKSFPVLPNPVAISSAINST